MKKIVFIFLTFSLTFIVKASDSFKLLDGDIIMLCNEKAKQKYSIPTIAKLGSRKPIIKRNDGNFIAVIQFFYNNSWISKKCIGSEIASLSGDYINDTKVVFE